MRSCRSCRWRPAGGSKSSRTRHGSRSRPGWCGTYSGLVDPAPAIARLRYAVNLQAPRKGLVMPKLLRLALAVVLAAGGTQARAAWHEAKSKHFIIYGNVDPQDLSDYAKKLER